MVAADPRCSSFEAYATRSIPRTYLIAPNGVIAQQSLGFSVEEINQTAQWIEAIAKSKAQKNWIRRQKKAPTM